MTDEDAPDVSPPVAQQHDPPLAQPTVTSPPVQPVEMSYTEVQQTYVGPLPLPATIRGHDEIEPGTARRFYDDYFAERQHDRDMERSEQELRRAVVEGNRSLAERGQNIALLVTLILGALAAVLAVTGHDPVAIVLGGTSLVGIVAAILTGRSRQHDNDSA